MEKLLQFRIVDSQRPETENHLCSERICVTSDMVREFVWLLQ